MEEKRAMHRTQSYITYLEAEIKRVNNVLEAVKKLVEKGPYPYMNTWDDYQRAIDDWMGKLMNVLEAGGG